MTQHTKELRRTVNLHQHVHDLRAGRSMAIQVAVLQTVSLKPECLTIGPACALSCMPNLCIESVFLPYQHPQVILFVFGIFFLVCHISFGT
ncbi:hypothetical protein PVAP13_1NG039724 [Panicum virgatum]|uniref:Uncharacterized protein n=1 Tax=Panicum virgatum TaxID=38727 RepID=A0A8T0WFE1_PANVG|nr:hypothetical protein PVAP13_1NG039724 [Panicum virgatum]